MECTQRFDDLSDDIVVLDGPITPDNSFDMSNNPQPLNHSTPKGSLNRWLSQDDLLLAPKKLQPHSTLSRRERLLKKVADDQDFTPERSEYFWDHHSVKRTGKEF